MTPGFYSKLAGWVLDHRWAVLAAGLLLTIVLGWTGSHIPLRADVTDLLPEGTPSAEDLKLYLRTFGTADSFFISLGDGGDAGIEKLEEAATILAERMEATGLFQSVRFRYTEEDLLDLAGYAMDHLPVLVPADRVGSLEARISPDRIRQALLSIRRAASGPPMPGPRKRMAALDPLGLLDMIDAPAPGQDLPLQVDTSTGLFLSADSTRLLVISVPVHPAQDIPFSHRLIETVSRLEEEVKARFPGLTIAHAGGHLFAVADEGRIRHDITTTATLSFVAITGLFAIFLRRIRVLLVLIVPLTLSTLWTLGVAAIYPGHLNVVTVAFAAILLGMGDDSLTHLYLRFREELIPGRTRAEALRRASASTGPSMVLATFTSGLAFAALLFVEFRGLSELGLIAAIGMIILLAATLILFPALIVAGTSPSAPVAPPRLPIGLFLRIHAAALRRRRLALTLAAITVTLFALSATRLEFSSDLRALRGEDPAQAQMERVLSSFGGLREEVHLVQVAPTADMALEAAGRLRPLCDALQAEGIISGYATATALHPPRSLQEARLEAFSAIDWSRARDVFERVAGDLEMNPGYFEPFLSRLDRWSLRDTVLLAGGAEDPAGLARRLMAGSTVSTTVFPAEGRSGADLVARLRELDPAVADGVRAASVGLVSADLSAVIERDFGRASIIALVAVVVSALAAFRRPAYLGLVLCPVVIGSLLMLGGLALLEVPINLMNLVATPLVFGLGIDFGVYMVNRHLEEGRADVPRVLRHTGGAILLTGLTTLAGFGALLSADFAGLRSMGWVAVLGIGGCLLAALIVLPLLLPPPRRSSPGPSSPPGSSRTRS